MATVYKAEITSHWISYSKEELEEILTEAVKKIERKKGNTIQIRVEEKKQVQSGGGIGRRTRRLIYSTQES